MRGLRVDKVVSDADRLSMRQEGSSVPARLKRWWKALPRRVRTYGPEVMGWAAVIGIFLWEARNATLGFQQMWRPGILWAAVGGISASFGCVFLVRTMMESFRAMGEDEKHKEGHFALALLKGGLAAGTFCVVLFGVWSNLAADNIRRGSHQIEAQADRGEVLKNIRAIEGDIRALPPTIEVGLEADKQRLANVESIGRQWDLPKLDSAPGGDCDADLKPTQRSLCNQATDLRADIKTAEEAIKLRAELELKLEVERAKLVDEVEGEGVEHLQEMASMFGDESQWKAVGNIATLIASAILGLVAAFLADMMMERRQQKQQPKEA